MTKYFSVLGDNSIDPMNPISIIRVTDDGVRLTDEYRHSKIPWTKNADYVARHLFVDTSNGTVGDVVKITKAQADQIEKKWDS